MGGHRGAAAVKRMAPCEFIFWVDRCAIFHVVKHHYSPPFHSCSANYWYWAYCGLCCCLRVVRLFPKRTQALGCSWPSAYCILRELVEHMQHFTFFSLFPPSYLPNLSRRRLKRIMNVERSSRHGWKNSPTMWVPLNPFVPFQCKVLNMQSDVGAGRGSYRDGINVDHGSCLYIRLLVWRRI
jgi:hypothetical protein